MSASPRSSISISTIYLKLKEKKNVKPKKAIVPAALSSLKNAAAKLFNIQAPKTIQSVYTEEGNEITSISEVVPGMTLIVSTKPAETDFSALGDHQDNTVDTPNNDIAVPEVNPRPQSKTQAQTNTSPTTGPKRVPPPPMAEPPKLTKDPSQPGMISKSGSNVKFSAPGSAKQSEPQSPTTSGPSSPRSPSPMNGGMSLIHSPSGLAIVQQSNEGSFNRNPSPRSGSPPRSAKGKKAGPAVEDEPEAVDIPLTEEELDQQRFEATGISELRMMSLMDTLKAANGGESAIKASKQTFREAMEHTPPIVQKLASRTQEAQAVQQAAIFARVERFYGDLPEHTSKLDETVAALLDGATFATAAGCHVTFRTALVGPQGAGKSTFLKILMRQTAVRMMASGQYKRTLSLFYDYETLQDTLENPIALYRAIVSSTIDQVAAVRIDLEPFAEMLKGYFSKMILLEKATPLPQQFTLKDDFRPAAAILKEAADSLYAALHDGGSLQVFLTNVFKMPHFIAKAFGFADVLYFVDHLDLADVDCAVDSDGLLNDDVSPLPLLEFAKLMVCDGGYVVSGRDESKLLDGLDPITDDATDLAAGTTVVSVIGSDSADEHSGDIEFSLHFEGDEGILRRDDCGGCSGFLARWDTIIAMAQTLLLEERRARDSRRAREAKLSLMQRLRELVALVFAGEEDADGVYHAFNKKLIDFEVHQNSVQESSDE